MSPRSQFLDDERETLKRETATEKRQRWLGCLQFETCEGSVLQVAQIDQSNRNLHKEIEMVAEESDLLASLKKNVLYFI